MKACLVESLIAIQSRFLGWIDESLPNEECSTWVASALVLELCKDGRGGFVPAFEPVTDRVDADGDEPVVAKN